MALVGASGQDRIVDAMEMAGTVRPVGKGHARREDAGASVMFEQFAVQVPDLAFQLAQGAAADRGGAIEAAHLRAGTDAGRAQVAFRFQAMEERIERAGAQAIPVMGQFLDDAQTEDRLLGSMMEDMEADEAADDVTIYFRYRHATTSIMPIDIGATADLPAADAMSHGHSTGLEPTMASPTASIP
jgi:hypothetical protein